MLRARENAIETSLAGSSEQPPLEAVELRRSFQQGAVVIHAVAGVSFTLRPGEFLAIMGPSGSGKSTLLHLLGGLDRPDGGKVLLEGKDLSKLSDNELALVRRRRLGFLLQFFSLLPTMTVIENVAFVLLLDGVEHPFEQAEAALYAVGLEKRLDHRPGQLSGGEQQRAALARALVANPAVILADEPTGSLDSNSGAEILQLLRRTADSGHAIVIATHDSVAFKYVDRVLRLADGQLQESCAGDSAERPGVQPSQSEKQTIA
jgi:putative ABC transport system ATP-binding protein